MRIKKYIAKSMRDALTQIKEDLGEDAVILKTRKIPKNVFSLGEKNEVEVTAAIDEETDCSKNTSLKPIAVSNKKDELKGVYGRPRTSCIVDMDRPDAPVVKKWSFSDGNKRINKEIPVNNGIKIDELKENLEELRVLVKSVINNKNQVDDSNVRNRDSIYNKLIDSEIRSDLADLIIKNVNGSADNSDLKNIAKKLSEVIAGEFPVSGPLRLKKDGPLIVAFVGPTGSGKTTTLAKLSAHCAINKNKKVSIIAADTYRIAAIEQIKIFADIVKVNLEVVFTPEEIPGALEACLWILQGEVNVIVGT
jgi:flagellar biosynthesis protein FlhF